MKVYVAYTTVRHEDAFSIIGVFDVLQDAITAVIKTFGHEIELDQDPDPSVVHRWTDGWGRYIQIEEFRIGEYADPCDWY